MVRLEFLNKVLKFNNFNEEISDVPNFYNHWIFTLVIVFFLFEVGLPRSIYDPMINIGY